MIAEDKLINSFYNGFWSLLVVSIVWLILIIIMIIFKRNLLARYDSMKKSILIFWLVILVMLIINLFIVNQFLIFYKDKDQVDNKRFIAITGTVVGFNEKTYYDDGKPTYDIPIIYIKETGKTISLKLKDVKLNESYDIIYLEHTRLAQKK